MTLDPVLHLIGRNSPLFIEDLKTHESRLSEIVSKSRFLVLGAAGTIGSAVALEIAKRTPKKLHIVDISENNLVEVVRDLRSQNVYLPDDFKALALDVGSIEYDTFIKSDGQYDYVLNLSALKHVRSEKDPFTLMRMLEVNIMNTIKTIEQSIASGAKKYFCVSTDKAANPANLMGASKRIMELFLVRYAERISISTARFANVAFSDGSLLFGFEQRIKKNQPIVAPNDVKRYFVTKQESGQLCLLSCLLGDSREIFFPKPSNEIKLTSFSDIAIRYLQSMNLQPSICSSEQDARDRALQIRKGEWPCLFTHSDTTGEKPYEEFFTDDEDVDLSRFIDLGVVKLDKQVQSELLERFLTKLEQLKQSQSWSKHDLVALIFDLIPDLQYEDTGKYLDSKM